MNVCLQIIYISFLSTVAGKRPYGLKGPKYLLADPLQKIVDQSRL